MKNYKLLTIIDRSIINVNGWVIKYKEIRKKSSLVS